MMACPMCPGLFVRIARVAQVATSVACDGKETAEGSGKEAEPIYHPVPGSTRATIYRRRPHFA